MTALRERPGRRAGERLARPRRAGPAWALPRLHLFRPWQYAVLVVAIVVSDVPLVLMVLNSFKTEQDILRYPPSLWPRDFTIDQYRQLFEVAPFATYVYNSAVVSVGTTAICIVLATMAAYAMVRFRFWFLRGLSEASLFAYMVPAILLLVPISRIVLELDLQNRLGTLVAIYTARLLPFGLWVMRSYCQGLSADLEEAAMVDGCSRFAAFRRIVVPMMVPGMIAVGIFTFNACWHEYLFAASLMSDPLKRTLSPGISYLQGSGEINWGLQFAASALMLLPIMVLFTVGQRHLVDASGEGAVR